jgi:hypothetical protein
LNKCPRCSKFVCTCNRRMLSSLRNDNLNEQEYYLLNEMRVIKIAATVKVPKVITLFIMQKMRLNCHFPSFAKNAVFADVTKMLCLQMSQKCCIQNQLLPGCNSMIKMYISIYYPTYLIIKKPIAFLNLWNLMKIVMVKAFPSDPIIVHIAQPMAPAIHQNDSMLPAIH